MTLPHVEGRRTECGCEVFTISVARASEARYVVVAMFHDAYDEQR